MERNKEVKRTKEDELNHKNPIEGDNCCMLSLTQSLSLIKKVCIEDIEDIISF